jgi:hypothetical protein
MNLSSMPVSASAPPMAPLAAPMARPNQGAKNSSPISMPQKAPPSAPVPTRLTACFDLAVLFPDHDRGVVERHDVLLLQADQRISHFHGAGLVVKGQYE